jgi:putative transposase
VAEYVDWFHHRRLHGELGLVPPVEFEAGYYASTADISIPTTVEASVSSL